MSAVVIDGGLVHYEAFGRGQPVLFLHGWLGSWRYWMPTMESISDKYRAYALDLWGFGDTDKSKPRYEIPDYVGLINNFLNNMGITEAPIIGHALGAAVAIEHAARFPDRTKKVMAVSLPMNPGAITRKLNDMVNRSVMSRMLYWRQMHRDVQQEADKTADGVVDRSIHSFSQIDMQSRLEMIAQSSDSMLLLVHGERDDLINPVSHNLLNGTWSNIHRIGLTESKHFPMLEETAKFYRLLQDFLDVQGELSRLQLKEEWRRRTR
ncbi:MAG TPA: alpha/beta hydrolase [Anaerolineae bacterium]|nr:alpha/beta hydrolase [Anaerolineae bacterium]HMR62555.1 alpha/beta hydrolase [Anaerolineae bacterium]